VDRFLLQCCCLQTASKLTNLKTVSRRAVKISAAAAADNFGWLGGAPSVFRRRRCQPAAEGSIPAEHLDISPERRHVAKDADKMKLWGP